MEYYPLVTVGIPTYKRNSELRDVLRDLVSQTYSNFEVVICDNDPDNLITFEDFPTLNIRYVKNDINIGLLKNTIKLVELARGELFCWISDDDRRSDMFLEALVKRYCDSKENIFVASDYILIDSNNNYLNARRESRLSTYRFLMSSSSLARRIGYFIRDQRFGKCNLFYGLFQTKYLKGLNLESISNDYSDYAFDNFLIYEVLKDFPVSFINDPHVYLTSSNFKHYDLGNSSSVFGYFKRSFTTSLKYFISSSVVERLVISLLIFPIFICHSLSRLFDRFFVSRFQRCDAESLSINFVEPIGGDKLELKEVTLVAVATKDIDATISALEYSQRAINFGEVLLISHYCPPTLKKIRHEKILPFKSVEDWGEFIVFDLFKYINTDYILLIHSDGFVVNRHSWSSEFLNYDYIGSPWPMPSDDYSFRTDEGELVRLGNSVSLRSKKLLEMPSKLGLGWVSFHGFLHEDGFICVQHRDALIDAGIKFPDLDLACQFGREFYDCKDVDEPFVFHKWRGRNKKYPNFEKI